MTLHEELKSLLKKDERLVSDDKLLKNKIVELSLKLDKDLIKLLLGNKKIKEHFFEEVEKTLIFDKEKFMKFIDNKEFLPDSYTSFKNKIGLTADRKYLAKNKEVVLSWPFKDCILEGGQEKEDEKRKEIFHNEILAPDEIDRLLEPKVFTNFKKFDEKGEHKVSELKPEDNLIIKGNNLLALHSLQKRYSGKVKLIYIDPPYNTGNDEFKYNDSFNHSTWLTFMKNRLEVAKKLLSQEGVIFVHIDHIEEAYLKILLDEVFGRDNYVNTIAIRSSTPSGTKTAHKDKNIIKQKDFILVYKKSSSAKFNPQYKRKDSWDTHFNYFVDKNKGKVTPFLNILIENKLLSPKSKLSDFNIDNPKHREFYLKYSDLICQTQSHKNEELKNKSKKLKDEVLFVNKGEKNETMFYNGRQLTPLSNSISKVVYKKELVDDFSMLLCDFWDDIDFQNTQNEGGVSLTNGKKPEELLHRIISLGSNEGDLILDFFGGSGTTGAVAHKMNRRYILIEQMHYIHDLPESRLKKVIQGEESGISKLMKWKGGGSFVYCELKQLNEEFVQKIKKAKDSKELLKIWEEMKNHAFLSYRVDEKLFDENIDEFKLLSTDEQNKLLVKCLDANNLYVNFSEMEDSQYKISKEDKDINKKLYGGL